MTHVATIIGVGAAVATFAGALLEYSRSAVLQRIEDFARIKEQFLRDAANCRTYGATRN